jgi:hypothetical protein
VFWVEFQRYRGGGGGGDCWGGDSGDSGGGCCVRERKLVVFSFIYFFSNCHILYKITNYID